MTQKIKIQSYFSIETDLAEEMRIWQEFVDGKDYSVDLKDATTNLPVSVRLVKEDEDYFVIVTSPLPSELFDRVIGRVTYALAKHSDYLLVYNRSEPN